MSSFYFLNSQDLIHYALDAVWEVLPAQNFFIVLAFIETNAALIPAVTSWDLTLNLKSNASSSIGVSDGQGLQTK